MATTPMRLGPAGAPSVAGAALCALLLAACSSGAPPPRPASEAPARAATTATSAASAAPKASESPAATAAPAGSAAPAGTGSAAASAAPAPEKPPEPPPIPPNTLVLHIGDSFTHAGFSQALRPRLKALGARYEVRAEQSTFTPTWAAKLGQLVASTQPDLVIITLGANEVANVNPPAHAPYIRRMIQHVGTRPCVWVSPPLWRKDTGIIDVIRTNTAPCRFFDSDALVPGPIPRRGDKIHPNDEGGAKWAEAFWNWLQAERAPDGIDPHGQRRPWALKPAPPEEHASKASAPALLEPVPGGGGK